MVGSLLANEFENGPSFRPAIIASRVTTGFKFLIFSISVLNRSINKVKLSLDLCCSPIKLVVFFTTVWFVAKQALNYLVRFSYERRNPLNRMENQPKVDFTRR